MKPVYERLETSVLDHGATGYVHDGQVIDFMNVGLGGLRTGIFNVADLCITTGVVLLLVELFQERTQPATG